MPIKYGYVIRTKIVWRDEVNLNWTWSLEEAVIMNRRKLATTHRKCLIGASQHKTPWIEIYSGRCITIIVDNKKPQNWVVTAKTFQSATVDCMHIRVHRKIYDTERRNKTENQRKTTSCAHNPNHSYGLGVGDLASGSLQDIQPENV